MHREERRKLLINRLEWVAFVVCAIGGAFALWVFALATP
jgi:hypothetical protein